MTNRPIYIQHGEIHIQTCSILYSGLPAAHKNFRERQHGSCDDLQILLIPIAHVSL